MNTNIPPDDFPVRVRSWTCNHFTISQAGDGAAEACVLLRKAADALEQLGPVEVQDIVVTKEVQGPVPEMNVTVYFNYVPE